MLLDGKKIRDQLIIKYKEKITSENLKIKLAIIEVGNNDASKIYIKNKVKYCEEVGIETDVYNLDENISEDELIDLIFELNADKEVTGIILQSPIPDHLNFDKCSNLIISSKDVDGFTRDNVYNLYLKRKGILPCTVKGIIALLDYYNVPIEGAHAVIVGRGNIVGKPLFLALENRNATVTLCHSKTVNLDRFTKDADILVAAAGVPNLIKADMVKNGAVLIDVGVSRIDGKIVGDIDKSCLSEYVKFTPNPGGVGPMTVAMIIDNLIEMKEGEK